MQPVTEDPRTLERPQLLANDRAGNDRIWRQHRASEGTGIFVGRTAEHILGAPRLHHISFVHDYDAIRNVIGRRKIVRDVDDRHAKRIAQLLNKLTMDMRSDASTIDTGSSATISFGLGDKRPRHRDTLQLPARKLMRNTAPHFSERQAHMLQRFVGRRLHRRLVASAPETAATCVREEIISSTFSAD